MGIMNKIFKKDKSLAAQKFKQDYADMVRVEMEVYKDPSDKSKSMTFITSYGKLCWILMDGVRQGIDAKASKKLLDQIAKVVNRGNDLFISSNIVEINTDSLSSLPTYNFNELGIIDDENSKLLFDAIYRFNNLSKLYDIK